MDYAQRTQPIPISNDSSLYASQQQQIPNQLQPPIMQVPTPTTAAIQQPPQTYDMSVSWTPQVVPQWTAPNNAPIGHPVAVEPIPPPIPISDTCIHPVSAPHSQQSHYTQYSSLPVTTTYWNPDMVNSQPETLDPPTLGPPTIPDVPSDPLIENAFTMNQPSVASVIQAPDIVSAPPQATAPHQVLPPTNQTAQSSQVGLQTNISEGPIYLEDALEVIKSHAERDFSGRRQTCSSTSGDDDDDNSRGPRSGEREKERRQANNARER